MFSIIKKYKRNLNNICKIREKGVSLISLIVIIIVLLILAAVTIKISSGDSGLIKKTKKGVAVYQNASVNESETLNEYAGKLKAFVEGPKATSIKFTADIVGWTTKDVTITATSDDPDYEIELKSEDSEWSVRKGNKITVSKNQQINARLKKNADQYSEDVATYNVRNIDKDAPDKTAPALKATTNSITATFEQKDDGSGIAKREYSIDNGTTWKAGDSVFTFSGLTQGKKYEIITRATDRVENQSISDVSYITTETIPKLVAGSNLTFTPSTSSWTNGNVSVAVSTTVKGYTLQTSTDGKSWGTTNPLTYTANGTAYARLWDGNNASAVATTNITNIDKLAPTNTAPTVAATTNKITITNKQVDQNAANGSGKSDLNASKTQYRLVTDTNGTTAVTGKDWQSSNVFSGLTQNTTYYVQTKVTDNAGNTTTSAVATAKTTSIPTPTTDSNLTFTPTPSGWTNGNVSVKVATTITGYTLQTSTDGKTWGTTNPLIYSANGTAYARLWDGNNASAVATTNITNIDKLAPTNTAPTVATTTNKITATLKQVDQNAGSGSGKSDLNASKTQYRLVTDTNGTTAVTGKDWQSSNAFSGLTQNTTYYVQTKVTDNAGNTTTSAVATAKTDTIPTPTTGANVIFTPSTSSWTNGNVSVNVATTITGYTLQTSTDGKTWGTTNPLIYSANGTAYARLWDGNNASAVATTNITNIDKLAPTNTAPTVATTTNKITATLKQVDQNAGSGSGKSDLNASKTQYRLVTDTNGTTAVTGKDWQSSNVFSGLTQNTTYYVQTKVTDNAGNTTTSAVATAKTGTIPTPTTGSNLTFTPSTSSWTNGNVSVAVSTTIKGYTLQTSTDGKTWGTTNPLIYSANGTAYARLWDGNNASAVATTNITNIDKLAPTNTAPTVSTTTNRMTITNKQVDQNAANGSGKSDLNASKTQYRLVTDTNGTTAVTGKDWQSSNVFSGLTQNTTYYVQTKVTDNAGNTTTSAVATAKTGTIPKLVPETPVGTKVGTTVVDGQTLDWYLFDTDATAGKAYLVSTPTYWVPDTTKPAVSGAWVPKLVSSSGKNTGAIRQAIQKLADGTDSYSSSSVTYTPSENTLSYYKSVNSQWSTNRGSVDFKRLNENEQAACYLADEDIFAGIKEQVNKAEGNLKGKIQTLVGGASAEQWCKAYNKQLAASSSKITCEYSTTYAPGYIYKVNGTAQNSGWTTNSKTIVGDDIYGAAYTNNHSDNSTYPFSKCWWWLASPSASNSIRACDVNTSDVNGTSSALHNSYSHNYSTRFSLLASVALDSFSNLTFTATPTTKTSGNVTVTVSTTVTGYTLQTSTDGTTWGTTNPLIFSQNGTAYARLWDGNNASAVATTNITNIDKLAPTNTAPTVATTTNKITITNKQVDQNAGSGSGKSDLNASKTQYRLVTDTNGTTAVTGKDWQSSNVFNGLTQNTTYYVQTKVTDNAGNTTISAVATAKTGTIPKLVSEISVGTKVGTTVVDGQTLDWYLFDTDETAGKAYLVSTPTYWVPDTTKPAVSGAWVPKLVSSPDSKTGAMNQAIKKSTSSVTYKPSDNTWNYFKSVNSQWSADRGSKDFKSLSPGEQTACYLADADIFAGIKDQVNNAEGNLKRKIQTLVGGASIEQWCKAYNKQSEASRSKITCEYHPQTIVSSIPPGYASKVNGTSSTDLGTIVGNDIYGAAGSNKRDSSNPFCSLWWLASPACTFNNYVCGAYGKYSHLSSTNSNDYDIRVSLFASVALDDISIDKNLTFTATPSGWTNGNVSVKVSTTVTGYTLQTSTDGKTWGTTNPLTFSQNGTAYARLWDGTNASSVATLNVTNIDKLVPTNTAPTGSSKDNGITVTLKQTDASATSSYGCSEIKASETRYAIKKSSSSTWGAWQSSNSFTGLEIGTRYDIKTKVTDYAGNSSESNVYTGIIPYTGYYADVNDDGTVDGVIFIDLAQGASGKWDGRIMGEPSPDEAYSYSAVTSGLRSYKTSTKVSSYSGKFGTKQVIVPNGTSGNARLYVMALSDFDTSTHTWSDACSKTQTVGSVTFRLPSKEEWSAFGGQLGITSIGYLFSGLSRSYWSSTEYDGSSAWFATLENGYMYHNNKTNGYSVRLCATF